MVVDCGASKSLGSVVALEDYCDLNDAKPMPLGIRVHPSENTKFGFGNGDVQETVSRADLEIMAGGKLGKVSIHSLLTKDDKYVPMLASMDFLRRSQA
eukprot:3571923-Alexandrium_andersonii.AAC.1